VGGPPAAALSSTQLPRLPLNGEVVSPCKTSLMRFAGGVREGRAAVIGRVVDVKGFSTLPGDELVAIDAGAPLRRPARTPGGRATGGGGFGDVRGRFVPARDGDDRDPRQGGRRGRVVVRGAGRCAAPIGRCHPGNAVGPPGQSGPGRPPDQDRGAGAGPAAMVVDRDGRTWGGSVGSGLGSGDDAWRRRRCRRWRPVVHRPAASRTRPAWCSSRRGCRRRGSWSSGAAIWLAPSPTRRSLLGWETEATDSPAALDGLLDWAGATAALIVLSHDPHVDTPALAAGLARGVPYVGALGSRATQSRRLERSDRAGVDADALDRIHRPIGLDLGGRRASEVALSIAAEILACHCGRDARPLRDGTGPINYRPRAERVVGPNHHIGSSYAMRAKRGILAHS
jgi:hypothetical protein